MQKPAAIITHKAWLKNSVENYLSDQAAKEASELFYKKTGVKIGWFGSHDRGHNEWQGCNISVVGWPLLSPDAISAAYSGDRAALMVAGIDWPAWDGVCSEWDAPNLIPPLPTQIVVRDWLLDQYAATIAQAIGRARAVNSPSEIRIHLYGGLNSREMEDVLAVHGVFINHKEKDTVHRTREIYRQRGSDLAAIREAIHQIGLDGRNASRRAVRAELTRIGKSADDHVIAGWIEEARNTGKLPPASKGGRPRSTGV
jgi:hypothetical protein